METDTLRKISENIVISDAKPEFFKLLPSTNSYLFERGKNGAEYGTVIIAAAQTAGKGRLGREFFSPEGTGLYMSVLLRGIKSEALPLLTPSAAVAVCRTAERFEVKGTKIKWVNDVFLGGRKVCGILTETAFSGENPDFSVIGVGINLFPHKNGFPDSIKDTAGTLFPEYVPGLFENFAAKLINELFPVLSAPGSDKIFDEYLARSFIIGRRISYLSGGKEFTAKAVGLSRDFKLSVQRDDGVTEELFSGEVSVKIK